MFFKFVVVFTVIFYLLLFFFYVLPFKPRHCFCPVFFFQLYPDINTFLTTPLPAVNFFGCVTRIQLYNFCKLVVFTNFDLCSVNNVLKVVMLLANTCLSVRISRTGNPEWFTSPKASMAYIDVGIFYNKFLVEFVYAVEHNFVCLFFVKVSLITDVILLLSFFLEKFWISVFCLEVTVPLFVIALIPL